MRTLLALILLVGAPVAAAQNLSVTGQIESLGAPEPCAPGATHRIKNTDVHLRSTAVDLNTVFGTRTFVGTDVSAGCPAVDVTSVGNAGFSLNVCNHPALGCAVTLDMCPAPKPATYLVFVAAQPGFLPVSVETGSFLLSPPFLTLFTGTTVATCQSIPLVIQGPFSLVGLDVFFQAASLPPSYPAAPALLSSVAKMKILPPGGCTSFACF